MHCRSCFLHARFIVVTSFNSTELNVFYFHQAVYSSIVSASMF